MSMLLALLSFSLPVLIGILIVHSLWIDKNNGFDLILKLSLGIGLGLGISSLLYFIYLLFFADKPYFLYIEILIFFITLIVILPKHKKSLQAHPLRASMSSLQIWMMIIAGIVFLSSFLGIVNYARQRVLGDWDAWMIYNRAARFMVRDQAAWQDSFSKEMSVIFHADYPLLLSLNIASRWDILDKEIAYVPMFQSILFSFACLGLIFSALTRLKSTGQASLGLILLAGVPFYLYEGGRQTADLPLAFYMLASIVFIFFYYQEKRPVLIAFAGLTAGLSAWTKNEGSLFLLISGTIIVIAEIRTRSFKNLYPYFAGLLFPLAVVLYFKFQLAPASEFLDGGISKILQDVIDISRHKMIFGSFMKLFLFNGGWYRVGILLILCIYYFVFHSRIKEIPQAVFIGFSIFTLQIIGYYAFYLISPYELEWHLSSSLDRLFIHVYPTILFVTLVASQSPESIFTSIAE